MDLPIDYIPGSIPPRFRWKQAVDTAGGGGARVVDCEGQLPVSAEGAVKTIIQMTKRLLKENALLIGQIDGMTKRIATQGAPPPAQPKKGGK